MTFRTYNDLEILLKLFPDKPWDRDYLSANPNITWDIVVQNPQIKWNWDMLSRNSNITWDIVVQNPDRPWNWSGLSENPNITWDIVVQNPQINWDWNLLSLNPNITWDIVVSNPQIKWNWDWLSTNKFKGKKYVYSQSNETYIELERYRKIQTTLYLSLVRAGYPDEIAYKISMEI